MPRVEATVNVGTVPLQELYVLVVDGCIKHLTPNFMENVSN